MITGLGRTGKPFAIQHWGIEPDILTTAKGLCAGYGVLAGVVVSGNVCQAIAAGSGAHTQGHTHTANPLSCAAASAVLRYLQRNVSHSHTPHLHFLHTALWWYHLLLGVLRGAQGIIERAATQGSALGELLRERLGENSIVGDIRGRGMFCASLQRQPSFLLLSIIIYINSRIIRFVRDRSITVIVVLLCRMEGIEIDDQLGRSSPSHLSLAGRISATAVACSTTS